MGSSLLSADLIAPFLVLPIHKPLPCHWPSRGRAHKTPFSRLAPPPSPPPQQPPGALWKKKAAPARQRRTYKTAEEVLAESQERGLAAGGGGGPVAQPILDLRGPTARVITDMEHLSAGPGVK
jgi:hypothetical protein